MSLEELKEIIDLAKARNALSLEGFAEEIKVDYERLRNIYYGRVKNFSDIPPLIKRRYPEILELYKVSNFTDNKTKILKEMEELRKEIGLLKSQLNRAGSENERLSRLIDQQNKVIESQQNISQSGAAALSLLKDLVEKR